MWRKYVVWTLLVGLLGGVLLGGVGEAIAGAQRETVTLKMVLASPAPRWEFLLPLAERVFEAENPNVDLVIEENIVPFAERLTVLRAAATAGTPLDIVSLDQPEVGEFAAAGFTTDLTPLIEAGDPKDPGLRGLNGWFAPNAAATKFGGRWHAIWAWTDARLLWYWKDLVAQAGVDPATDMVTWDGYIRSCQKLNRALADRGIEGCLLIGQPWINDWTLPYVWMQGGDIGLDVNPDVAQEVGAEESWVPTFNSPAWVSALQFTRDQVEAGIEPFTEHQFGPSFVARKWATWLGGTWVLGRLAEAGSDLSQVGLLGAFPVPTAGMTTATMAGGWTLAIPSTSERPDVAWEFLKVMLREETLGAMVTQFGFLPTRRDFAENLEEGFQAFWNQGGIDRWSEIQKLQPNAFGRPSFPTWPQIASAITDMVQRVMFDDVDPVTSAQEAQRTALKILGWPASTVVAPHDDQQGPLQQCPHRLDNPRIVLTFGDQVVDKDGDGLICAHVLLP